MTSLSGLTWDHPRGFNALDAAARLEKSRGGIEIQWSRQPLEGFEEHPIEELCAGYDLVVLDHPHIGEAVKSRSLVPLEDVLTNEQIADISRRTIGACFDSYRYAGKHWALPLDAAAQVMANRPDAVEPPETWDGIVTAAAKAPTVLSLAGPHAALTLFSIALTLSGRLAVDGRLFQAGVGEAALEIMQQIHDRAPAVARSLNPIGILQTMAETDEIALCPLIFGYVNYASSDIRLPAHRLAFADAPVSKGLGRRGSILGGTGIGLTKRCNVTPELVRHLIWLMGNDAQMRFIPEHDGQPSARDAWRDKNVNQAWGEFYRSTEDTLEHAHVRPRYAGYIAFQKRASQIVRDGLEGSRSHAATIAALEQAYISSAPMTQER